MITDQSEILDCSEMSDLGESNSPVKVSNVVDSLIVGRLHGVIISVFLFLFNKIGPLTVSQLVYQYL